MAAFPPVSPEEFVRLMAHNQAMQLMQAQGLSGVGWISQSAPQPTPAAIPRAEMRVEDVIGWRVWRVTPIGYLQSVSATSIWLPGEAMVGRVGDHDGLGVHAFKSRATALAGYGQTTSFAIGSVLLWGDVVEHERGYRAERAKIKSIDDLSWGGEPPWSETTQKALAFLRERYAVTVK